MVIRFSHTHQKTETRQCNHFNGAHILVLPMTKGRDEVKAAVYAVVLDVLAVQAALVPEVLLKLLVDVVGDRLPAKAGKNARTFSL